MKGLVRGFELLLGFNPIEWLRTTRRVLRLIEEGEVSTSSPGARRFGVVVLPWLSTNVPWFSIVCGLLLSRRGYRVTFVFDDLPFGDRPFRFAFTIKCLRRALKALSVRYDVTVLSGYCSKQDLSPVQAESLRKLVQLNSVWAMRGEMATAGRGKYAQIISNQLTDSYGAVCSFLAKQAFDAILVPGGIYGASGVWRECAEVTGTRMATFDSGPKTLLLSTDGVAAQLHDVPRAFALLKERLASEQEKQFVIDAAFAEIRRRKAGKDQFSLQVVEKSRNDLIFKDAVLIALNSPWDSSALGLHAVFESTTQWIEETVRWVLENTNFHVVVRQHPAERLKIVRSRDDYRAFLEDQFGSSERVHFVAADDPVNTYDLMEAAKVVVVYTSTIGVEAAFLDKVVLTASKCYYSHLGFVWSADNRQVYFRYLREALEGRLEVSGSMKEDALFCYYLTQCCNWIFSNFNPHDFEFRDEMSLEDLDSRGDVQLILQAIGDNVPYPYLRHLSNLKAGSK